MILGKEAILRSIDDGNIYIYPFSPDNVGPNSYDITLNATLKVYKEKELDAKKKNETEEILIPQEGFLLQPGELYLGETLEYTRTENLVPLLVGRSSIGRLGIAVHITAGFGDNGFKGTWTLEITCIKPVKIYPYMKIGQIYYQTVDGEAKYDGRYVDQVGPTESRFYQG